MRLTGYKEAKVTALISFCAVLAFAQPQPPPPQQNAQEAEATRNREADHWREVSLSTDVDASVSLPNIRF